MTSRKSSGSMRADSAVEPTKSENITVTWRRSALSWGLGSRCRLSVAGVASRSAKFGYRAQQFASITQSNAQVFQVLIG